MKTLLLSALVVLIATSCATIKVSSDYDRTAPFAGYKTYALTNEVLNVNLDVLNRNRIISAVEHELGLKGFTKSETPDVLIDIQLTAEQKATAVANTVPMYGAGYRYRWGGGFSTTTIDVDRYVEGTLFIDMIDNSKKQLVWQGRGIGTINPDVSSEKREANINNAVKTIFAKYPPAIK